MLVADGTLGIIYLPKWSDSFVEKCHKWGYEATKQQMTDDGDNVSIVVGEAEQTPDTKRHRLTLGKAIADINKSRSTVGNMWLFVRDTSTNGVPRCSSKCG